MTTVNDLFDVRYGQSLELNRLSTTDQARGIAFVSRKMVDNGISAFVKPVTGETPGDPGELTVALGGNGVLSTFIQERPFYTGRDVAILKKKTNLPKSTLLYYCVCIRANRYRFSYGRQANRTLKQIGLPDPNELPDWVCDPVIDFTGNDAPKETTVVPPTDAIQWKPFRLSELFEIKRGQGIPKNERAHGNTPYIGALNRKNGLVEFVDREPMHPGNTLTLNWNGIGGVGIAFYQSVPYWCSGDVNALYPRFALNSAIAMFIISLIRKERYRFSFGRKLTQSRMADLEIRLPVTVAGEPDWSFMEQLVNTLPFSCKL